MGRTPAFASCSCHPPLALVALSSVHHTLAVAERTLPVRRQRACSAEHLACLEGQDRGEREA
jgi:hypothetical protein